jgi:protease II
MQPPHAAKLAHQIEIHGDTIVDDYFWLRDRNYSLPTKEIDALSIH